MQVRPWGQDHVLARGFHPDASNVANVVALSERRDRIIDPRPTQKRLALSARGGTRDLELTDGALAEAR